MAHANYTTTTRCCWHKYFISIHIPLPQSYRLCPRQVWPASRNFRSNPSHAANWPTEIYALVNTIRPKTSQRSYSTSRQIENAIPHRSPIFIVSDCPSVSVSLFVWHLSRATFPQHIKYSIFRNGHIKSRRLENA